MSEYSFSVFNSLKPFEVDIKHLMEDIRDHYTYPIEEAVIVENVDNCIDAKYTEIHFNVKNGVLEIIMLGDCINEETFWKVLPKIAATTKVKEKSKTALGRYGWGMKVVMYVSKYVIIETKCENFHAAQRWELYKGVPMWGKVSSLKRRIMNDKFTIITLHLKDEYSMKITPEFIEKTLQKYYPTVLSGAKVKNAEGKARELKIFVNSNLVKPPIRVRWEKKMPLRINVNGEEATGYVYLAKEKLSEEDRGIAIIVHGRRISNEFFGVYGTKNDRITGYLHADMLINDLAGDKTSIRRKSGKWQKLKREAAKQLSKFMKEIGAIREEKLPKKTITWVHEEINKLIKHFPELQKLAIKPNKYVSKKVLIQKEEGKIPATLMEGAQRVSGTEKGPGKGGKVPAWVGEEKAKSPYLDSHGKSKAVKVKRKVKVGVRIDPRPFPGVLKEAWYSPEGVIYVNTAFPSYKKA